MKIGAVLTYHSNGRGGICGQVIGADGAGDQAVVFTGDDDECAAKVTEFIAKLKLHERETARLVELSAFTNIKII
jgi:hypothetical protein